MKIGRPRLNTEEKKSKITGVRLNGDERNLIQIAAANAGQTLSQWLRETLLEKASVQSNTPAKPSAARIH